MRTRCDHIQIYYRIFENYIFEYIGFRNNQNRVYLLIILFKNKKCFKIDETEKRKTEQINF